MFDTRVSEPFAIILFGFRSHTQTALSSSGLITWTFVTTLASLPRISAYTQFVWFLSHEHVPYILWKKYHLPRLAFTHEPVPSVLCIISRTPRLR